MAVRDPQYDLQQGIDGGTDLWDDSTAGALLLDDYFGQPTAYSAPTLEVISSAQYMNDGETPIAIGASSSGDGVTNNIQLEQDIYLSAKNTILTPNFEARPIGTGFSNVATEPVVSHNLRTTSLPVSRRGGTMHYDPGNKRMIHYGGYDGTNRFADYWSIDMGDALGQWKEVMPQGTRPVARNLHAGVTFTLSGRTFTGVWGGVMQSGTETNDFILTEVTKEGAEQCYTLTQTNAPTIRSYITEHMVVKKLSETQVEIFLVGGWAAAYENAVYKCTYTLGSTAVTWSTIGAQGAANAPATGRRGANCIYDSASNSIWLFGGYNGTTYVTTLYRFDIGTNTWSQPTVTGDIPATRELACSAYDETTKMWYIFGGYLATATSSRNDVFRYDLTNPSAPVGKLLKTNDVTDSAFYPSSSLACAIDTTQRVIVFGMGNGYDDFLKYMYLFDPKLNETTEATVFGLGQQDDFRARDAAAFAYNPDRQEMLFVGGYSEMADDTTITTGAHTAQMWAMSYSVANGGKVRYPTVGDKTVTAREGSMMVWDSINKRFILFGGLNGIQQVMNDVWEIKPDTYGNYKVRKMRPTGTKPGSRWLGACAFDAANNRMVIWGGEGLNVLIANTDMWALNLSADSTNGVWAQLTPTGTAPAARWQPAYWHDTVSNELFITGGSTANGDTTYATDLVKLSLNTTNPAWTSLTSTTNKAVRGGILFGSSAGRLSYFGGFDGNFVTSSLLNIAKTGGTWTVQSITGTVPPARRSMFGFVQSDEGANGRIDVIISSGRPASGKWFNDMFLVQNAATGTATSTEIAYKTYLRITSQATGKTANTGYHWQSWQNIYTGSSAYSSFGNNSESAIDFATGTIAVGGLKKVLLSGTFQSKPVKVKIGGTFVTKPVKVKIGGSWIDA